VRILTWRRKSEWSNRNFTDKLNNSRRFNPAFRFAFATSGKQSAEQPMTRVLVIDDQNDVRAVICTMLQVNRFDVVEAAIGAAWGATPTAPCAHGRA
jgi:PleD family two-component response regulator